MLKEPTRRIRFLTPRGSATAARRVAGASGGHGGVLVSRRVCGRPTSPGCSGRKWIWHGGWRGFIPTKRRRGKAIPVPLNAEAVVADRKQLGKHPTHVFSYPGQADHAGQHQGLVRGLERCRHQGFSLARSAAHLGELARAERHAAVRAAGVRRLGESRRWCGVTRTLPRITWRRMRSASVHCVRRVANFTAQLRSQA